MSLEIEGRTLETVDASIGANASASISFAPFTLAEPTVRGMVKAGSDPLAADNTFDFVLSPSKPMSVLIIDSPDAADSSFYLSNALAIGKAPAFKVETAPASRVSSGIAREAVRRRSSTTPRCRSACPARCCAATSSTAAACWSRSASTPCGRPARRTCCPASSGAVVDRTAGRGATIGWRDYSHQVFEIFKAPRSGDFSAARVYRYRTLEPGPGDRVLARYDDGAVAAVERRVGTGRVIAWTTTLDREWSDLPQTPVFLPLVHQLVRYLAQYEQTTEWTTVGQVVDLSAMLKSRADRIVMTPSGNRVTVASSEPGVVELNEQGVYEIRAAASRCVGPRRAHRRQPRSGRIRPVGRRSPGAGRSRHRTRRRPPPPARPAPPRSRPADAEKQQGLWWYLLLAGMVLLAAETVIANRLSRNERFT